MTKNQTSKNMTICKSCNKEIAKSAKTCPSCDAEQKKPIYKKWLFWVGIIFLAILISSGGEKEKEDNGTQETEQTENSEKKEVTLIDFSNMTFDEITTWCQVNKIECEKKNNYSDTVEKGNFLSQSVQNGEGIYEGGKVNIVYSLGKKPSIEYQNALKKAESYSNTMHMSKQAIYDQLISQYGENFPQDAAQYAIDNIVADWNANALEKAKSYQQTMSMSKNAIYNQLISQYGEKFTEAEAQYAIDNLTD